MKLNPGINEGLDWFLSPKWTAWGISKEEGLEKKQSRSSIDIWCAISSTRHLHILVHHDYVDFETAIIVMSTSKSIASYRSHYVISSKYLPAGPRYSEIEVTIAAAREEREKLKLTQRVSEFGVNLVIAGLNIPLQTQLYSSSEKQVLPLTLYPQMPLYIDSRISLSQTVSGLNYFGVNKGLFGHCPIYPRVVWWKWSCRWSL